MKSRSHLVSVRNTAQTRVSLIIVTRNSTRTLRPCLESVLRHLGQNDEVLVIDNASTDGTPDLAEEIYLASSLDPAGNLRMRLRYYQNCTDQGFSRAANQGMAAANGLYFVLMSPDILVTEGWLEAMISHLVEPNVGAIGPLIDIGDGPQNAAIFLPEQQVLESRTWEDEEVTCDSIEAIAAVARNRYAGRHKEVNYLFTNCILIPRSTIEETGPLDEDLFLGGEDLEFSWRLNRDGKRLLVAADALVSGSGGAYFESLAKETAAYLGQLAVNRVAEKIVSYYLVRNETPPGAERIWGIEGFRPSQQPVHVAIISDGAEPARASIERLQSQSAVPLKITLVEPNVQSINRFFGNAGGLTMIVEAGTALGPGWMSRIAAAGEMLTAPAIIFPNWGEYSDEEPTEHGIRVRHLPELSASHGLVCYVISLDRPPSEALLEEGTGTWKEALQSGLNRLVSSGAQSVEIADLKAKGLLL